MSEERLFIGKFPCGFVYADRHVEIYNDFKRLAFLSYNILELVIVPDCPADLKKEIEAHAKSIKDRKGELLQVTTSGQTVRLGGENT